MNINDAKTHLLLYRPGTTDAEDPQVAEALELAKNHPELAQWLQAQQASQKALRAKFNQIAPPAGLKEQIISERAASQRATRIRRPLLAGVAALVLIGGILALLLPTIQSAFRPGHSPENTLAHYQSRMVRIATDVYGMDRETNALTPILAYLAQQHAPSDIHLSAPLQQTTLTGCAVEDWQGAKVSLVCFSTGKPLLPPSKADLWLFVVDRTAVKDASAATVPQIAAVNRLVTATWTDGNKLYVLAMQGSESDLRRYL